MRPDFPIRYIEPVFRPPSEAQSLHWETLPLSGLIKEMEQYLSRLELTHTVFRNDHASNRLLLQGTLSADKVRLLATIRLASEQPDAAPLHRKWATGL